jgi:hypothetical protein
MNVSLFISLVISALLQSQPTIDGLWPFPNGHYIAAQADRSSPCVFEGQSWFRLAVTDVRSDPFGAVAESGSFELVLDGERFDGEVTMALSSAGRIDVHEMRTSTLIIGELRGLEGADYGSEVVFAATFLITDHRDVDLIDFKLTQRNETRAVIAPVDQPRLVGAHPDGTILPAFQSCVRPVTAK